MPEVLLIEPFEVEAGQDETFLEGWEAARRLMSTQPGYLGSTLHRAMDASATLRYVNVVTWESADDYYELLDNPDFLPIRESLRPAGQPTLYEQVAGDRGAP